jgi:hypothetical protein
MARIDDDQLREELMSFLRANESHRESTSLFGAIDWDFLGALFGFMTLGPIVEKSLRTKARRRGHKTIASWFKRIIF